MVHLAAERLISGAGGGAMILPDRAGAFAAGAVLAAGFFAGAFACRASAFAQPFTGPCSWPPGHCVQSAPAGKRLWPGVAFGPLKCLSERSLTGINCGAGHAGCTERHAFLGASSKSLSSLSSSMLMSSPSESSWMAFFFCLVAFFACMHAFLVIHLHNIRKDYPVYSLPCRARVRADRGLSSLLALYKSDASQLRWLHGQGPLSS